MKKIKSIQIRGCTTHNLNGVDVDIPINEVTCIFGPSGSGKSSLAFHTLALESKRRFLNSMPTDMKFFWDIPQTAEVEKISPVLPVWSLPQINPVIGSRSNILDLLGLTEKIASLVSYEGEFFCPDHNLSVQRVNAFEIVLEKIRKKNSDKKINFFLKKEEFISRFGIEFYPPRSFNGNEISEFDENDEYWEVFRGKANNTDKVLKNLKEMFSLERPFHIYFVLDGSKKVDEFSNDGLAKCSKCGWLPPYQQVLPNLVNPLVSVGACKKCKGYGANLVYDKKKLVKKVNNSILEGAINILEYSKFNKYKAAFLVEARKKNISLKLPFKELDQVAVWHLLFKGAGNYPGLDILLKRLEGQKYKMSVRIYIRGLQKEIVCSSCLATRVEKEVGEIELFDVKYNELLLGKILTIKDYFLDFKKNYLLKNESKKILLQINEILTSAIELGLGETFLLTKAKTLTPSEYQRSLLVKFLSFKGSGSLFVLDEPSVGLTTQEQKKLLKSIKTLKEQGNTIVLVEHSEYLKKSSDYLIQMGPGAGSQGGKVVFKGKREKLKIKKVILKNISKADLTNTFSLKIKNESGKLTFIKNGLNLITSDNLKRASLLIEEVAELYHRSVYGLELNTDLDKFHISLESKKKIFKGVHYIPSLFKKSSGRSTIGSFLGISPYVRKHYSSLNISKELNLKDGHFSTNSELGRCPSCDGTGVKKVDMQFLEDLEFSCDDCMGMKLKPFLANISDGHKTVSQTYREPLNDVKEHIKLTPKLRRIFERIEMLNLGHLNLERKLSTLSGGERQRLRLLGQLEKPIEGSLLVLENISFGLSSTDMIKMIDFLLNFRDLSNTIVVIDENPLLHEASDKLLNLKQL